MPPTTQGQRARGRIAEFRQNVANGATPAQARTTVRQIQTGPTGMANAATPTNVAPAPVQTSPVPFRVNTPDTINPATIQNAPGRTEVFARRDQMQAETDQRNQLNTDYTSLNSRINAPLGATPFQNPQAFIEETLLRRPTQTQDALNERAGTQAQGFRNLSNDVQNTREQTAQDLGVVDIQANLAETRNRIADRTVQLRTALRDFEVNAERRGVAREFVDSEKQKVQADAAAELADLAIIESAQAGNLEMAQADIDRAVNAKIQAFEFENAAIETEIKRLEAIDTNEARGRSEQLQIALQERTRLIDQSVADEKQKLSFLSEAAANGADQGTLDAIRKSATPGEAALLAGPYIGLMERRVQQANINQSNASVRSSNAAAALNEAELTAFNKAQEDAAKGILSPEQMKIANDLNKDFEAQPIVKAYNEGLQKYMVMEDTLANGIDGVQDLQLVYDFMKSVDPASVVRETEFANAAKTGNIFQGAYASFNKAFGSGGFLPETVKQDFMRSTRSAFEAKNNQYLNVKAEAAKRVNNTISVSNGADYLTAYEAAAPITQSDNDIVFGLSGATPEDINEIMLMTEQMMSQGTKGANIYK